jgi:diaminopropionate ammonia-lyase
MIHHSSRVTHFANTRSASSLAYPDHLKESLNLRDAETAFGEISSWPNYRVTPLHQLNGLAGELGIGNVFYKDESSRFGLGSFKALGGAYAVLVQLKKIVTAETGHAVTTAEILNGSYKELIAGIVISCATDGNHGRSVAWGAQLFGCQCVIYIHAHVSEGRESAIRSFGAEIIRVDGNYDESVRKAALDSVTYKRIIVSDTSYAGYAEIPKLVALGYTVMIKEIIEQLCDEIPTHVFLQAGVGGFAAAFCAYFWQYWGNKRPRLIVVEPETANCLQQSARQGSPVVVGGDLETLMAGLACGEVSTLAWEILSIGCDDFVTIDEASVAPCMRLLAEGDPHIVAGESAVAGVAALIGAIQSETMKANLKLHPTSSILVIGTEGATDQKLYDELVSG